MMTARKPQLDLKRRLLQRLGKGRVMGTTTELFNGLCGCVSPSQKHVGLDSKNSLTLAKMGNFGVYSIPRCAHGDTAQSWKTLRCVVRSIKTTSVIMKQFLIVATDRRVSISTD